MKKKFESFSVPLGLLDYGNPVFYTVTMVTILKNMYGVMDRPFNVILLIGAIISIFFGLVIPTGKVIVGLGLIEFRMPVSLVAELLVYWDDCAAFVKKGLGPALQKAGLKSVEKFSVDSINVQCDNHNQSSFRL